MRFRMFHYFFLFLLGLSLVIGQEKRAHFSGTWKLDKRTSTDLPESFKHVDAYLLHVGQGPDSMSVVAEMSGDGQNVTLPVTLYEFDGHEVYREDTLRASKRWIKASWTSTGEKLIVTNRVVQKVGSPQENRYEQTDVWQFSKKRNTLLIFITQKFEDPSKPSHTERRYFHRVGD